MTMSAALICLLVSQFPKPKPVQGEPGLDTPGPLMIRAASNISHTLCADIVWLASSKSTEGGNLAGGAVGSEAELITVLDPSFFPAIRYYATYLAGVEGNISAGAALYETAGRFLPNDFRLMFSEMLLRVTYEEPLDNERMIMLAKRAVLLPGRNRYFGDVDYSAMVEGLMVYAADRFQRRKQKKVEMKWLLDRTVDPGRKRAILKYMKTIE